MCRPIESRDSLGVIGPAALFAAYQPSGNTKNLPNVTSTASAKVLANIRGTMNTTMWAMDSPPLNMNTFGSMDMLPMTTQPPALPFVCFPKTTNELSAMPWNNVTTSQDSMNCSLNIEQALEEEEMKPVTLSSPFTVPRRMNDANEAFEAAELEELLDFSMPDDLTNLEKDKEDLIHLEDGFDGTEMSILYSFLVDAPEEKALNADTSTFNSDDGILNLNMLQRTPLESLMESLEGDFTDEELKMTPPPSMEESKHLHLPKGSVPEVKSRRLCRAEDCYKRSRSNGMCISHGGGRRCAVEGCDKSSQGGNLCIRHGGGKRCSFEDCDKAAQSNFLCKAHGGGPRCQIEGCERSSQGGGHCRSHGGGKRCMFDGCQKGTQRGDYCALHGGSRLCEIPGCMRNDRGGGLCATHGGGKRCSVENCIKPCRRKGFCSAHLRQSESTK